MPPAQGGGKPLSDFQLSKHDRLQLPVKLARVFPSQQSAEQFLVQDMRIPAGRIPLYRTGDNSERYWRRVLDQFDAEDVVEMPYRRLALAVRERQLRAAPVDWMFRNYWMSDPTDPEEAKATGPRAAGCHPIVWTRSPAVRESVREWLESELLAPREVWHNHDMTSFEVNEADVGVVSDQIRYRYAELLVKVIPAREPDYTIDDIAVVGSGRRGLTVPKVPIQLTVAELAESAAWLHPALESTTPRMGVEPPRGRPPMHHGKGFHRPVSLASTLLECKFRDEDKVIVDSVRFKEIRVVFVGSSPHSNDGNGLSDVQFGKELEKLKKQMKPGRINLVGDVLHARLDHLAGIMRLNPDVIHLACHGRGGELFWEDGQGSAEAVRAAWLADQIAGRAGRHVSGLVLSSCDGETFGPTFLEAAREVIAHPRRLADSLAITFTTNFYEVLHETPVLRTAARLASPDGSVMVFPLDGQGGS